MNYKKSGVDIALANTVVSDLVKTLPQTYSPQVLGNIGHFGAFYELPSGYTKPVLVSCTDGVGTKLRLAIDLNNYSTIGIDLVAMCVNDLICSGATPLYFLDYYACFSINKHQIAAIMQGMISGCKQSGLSLIGGEIAEMGDCYQPNEFDLAGFCVGVVEKSELITGRSIEPGHKLYGLASSGIHANGFSLVRQVLTPTVCHDRGIDPASLLVPTEIYVKAIKKMQAKHTLSGIAHITGGGLAENVSRILPAHVSAIIKLDSWPILPIFNHVQVAGHVSDEEMYRVFNMGIGMVIITPETLTYPNCYELGYITGGNGTVEWV